MSASENKADFRESLDRYAEEYLSPDPARRVDQKLMAMLVARVVPHLEGPDVLEMGYGDGQWTDPIVRKFGHSCVIDASSELIEAVQQRFGPKVQAFHSYFEEFKPEKQWDTVVCTNVLEHVVNPVQVLAACRTWLHPGGQLVVAVPNANSLHRRLGVALGMQKTAGELGESDRRIGHRRVYDSAGLLHDVTSAGFKVEQSVPVACKPLPNSLLANLDDVRLTGLFDLGDLIEEDERGELVLYCRA